MAEQMLQNQDNSLEHKGGRLFVLIFIFLLLGAIGGGLFWLFVLSSASPVGLGWYLFAFASGLSMIVLPCTLPLAFVIVPLVMGKGYKKGVATALSFGIGVALTLSMYGVLAAIVGKAILSFSGGAGETVKNLFYAFAGLFALVFALSELGFVKFRLPSYSGAAPAFIQRRQDILKPFLMGLFLGNIGVGCPHPATPIILGQIAIVGDVLYGWLLFFTHAIGRIVPLLVLAMLGIIGINATKALVRHKDAIAKATAWAMVFVGGFLFTLGFFSHAWWTYSGSHSLLEVITQEERVLGAISERWQVGAPHTHGLKELEGSAGLFGAPLWLGSWVLVALWVVPIWWHWFREKKRIRTLGELEQSFEKKVLAVKKWFFVTLTILLGLVFIYTIPHWFQKHKAVEKEGDMPHKEEIFREEGMQSEIMHQE